MSNAINVLKDLNLTKNILNVIKYIIRKKKLVKINLIMEFIIVNLVFRAFKQRILWYVKNVMMDIY